MRLVAAAAGAGAEGLLLLFSTGGEAEGSAVTVLLTCPRVPRETFGAVFVAFFLLAIVLSPWD